MAQRSRALWNHALLFVALFVSALLIVSSVADANRGGMSFNELKRPPAPPPLLPGQASATYPVGFHGLNFNTDGQNTLELDLGAAQTAGAEVTSYADRVEVFQHSSPEVRITFRGTGFEYHDGKIVGKVTSADFATSPLTGSIAGGSVTGATRVELLALSGRADCIHLIDANVTADVESRFSASAAAHNLDYNGTAFTFNVTKLNLDGTGTANLTFTIPSDWVLSRDGISGIYVARIGENDPSAQILPVSYLGEEQPGSLKFRGYSPNGTSVFGLISAKVQSAHGIDSPGGQISTDLGLVSWGASLVTGNILLAGAGLIALTGGVYFGRRMYKKEK